MTKLAEGAEPLTETPDGEGTEDLRQFTVMLARKLARGQFDPEDLAHEALERWLRCAPRLAPVNPRAWVTVVLRRLLVDRLRRRRAAAEVPADCTSLAVSEPDTAPWWSDIELGVLRRELGRLPPALRETFELFSFESRSYQQIAYQLNIAMGTVGTRISRARALLRRRLLEHRGAAARGRRIAGAVAPVAHEAQVACEAQVVRAAAVVRDAAPVREAAALAAAVREAAAIREAQVVTEATVREAPAHRDAHALRDVAVRARPRSRELANSALRSAAFSVTAGGRIGHGGSRSQVARELASR